MGMDNEQKRNDLAALQAKLAQSRGKDLWRGLEEVSETEEFNRWLDDEFPNRGTLPHVDRRDFLKFMGASMLLAGLSGCRFLPKSHIVPHVMGPEDRVTGIAVYYATTFVQNGFGTGVLVRTYEGRPLKIEGNALHPSSLGASDATMQAAMQTMYDPDRAKAVTYRGEPSTWELALGSFRKCLEQTKKGELGPVAILTPVTTSPTFAAWLRKFVNQTGARWFQYDGVGRDAAREGVRMAFGDDTTPVYDFKKANVIVSLDADFFSEGPGHVRYTRDFAERRRVHGEEVELNRVYAVESTPNLVGAFADNKKRCKASEVRQVAEALATAIGLGSGGTAPASVGDSFVQQAAQELLANRGSCLVVPGEHQPKEVHALAHAMNVFLGNSGLTVTYVEPVEADSKSGVLSIGRLVEAIGSDQVGTLLVLGGNPAFDAPADLNFAGALSKVEHTFHMGVYANETSELCDWHLPEAYFLEAWGDARAHDGTASIIQPLIEPLYEGKSQLEVIAALCNDPRPGHDLVRDFWMKDRGLSKEAWERALHDGVIEGTAGREVAATLQPLNLDPAQTTSGLEVIFRPDPTIGDGFYANNGWLQELPKPLTKTTWDNCVYVSPKTAEELKLNVWRDADNPQHDLAEVTVGSASVRAPVIIQPGHPDGAITLHVGYGRTKAGAIGDGCGSNVYPLRTTATMHFAGSATLKVVGKTKVANTQYHHSMHGRDIVRYGSVSKYKENPTLEPPGTMHIGGHGKDEDKYNLFRQGKKDHAFDGHQWAMVIDLGLCVGCNACVSACNVENNIAVVGKDQVINGREMHWIRIDRYYGSKDGAPSLDSPDTHFMPLACMHCEMAPCEPVCPVAATVHSAEGLNMMVYNRCVGTRYCSNNCPYKVRRFNFLYFTKQYEKPSLKMLMNPDVTVRSRGVMEKCTFCVQRINKARIEEKKSGVPLKDGDVITACQQACPTQAIIFGDLTDEQSQVNKWRHEHRNYTLLPELGIRPRTTYLAKVTNPNEEVEA